ncbi:hypothetical protein AgCh_032885 [Apium graveolens]
MGSAVDYTYRCSDDNEALDRLIADCFMDPQPCSNYYCEPVSVASTPLENKVISRDDVIFSNKEEKLNSCIHPKRVVQFDAVSASEETQQFVAKLLGTENTNKKILEEKLNSRIHQKRVVQFDAVSSLEETQRFVAKLLGTENTNKKIKVSQSSVGYGVTKSEFASKSLNPKQQPRDKTSLGHEKQFIVTNDYNSRLKAFKCQMATRRMINKATRRMINKATQRMIFMYPTDDQFKHLLTVTTQSHASSVCKRNVAAYSAGFLRTKKHYHFHAIMKIFKDAGIE